MDQTNTPEDQGKRLREERQRLGYSQERFGALAGVRRMSQGKYEVGESSPTVRYLEAIANVGADVYYIVTGIREYQAVATPCQELRRLEKKAMDMVEDFVKALPGQRLDAAQRYTLFDAFRAQLKIAGSTKE